MSEICRVCKAHSETFGNTKILGRYEIDYFRCVDCGFVQTEEPYWLDEAYQDAIIPTDVGLVSRNQQFSKVATLVLRYLLPDARTGVDYGGGYGMFTRMMRDFGHDFAHLDPFCENLFAKGHEIELNAPKRDLLTAFEVWEHMADPHAEISKMDRLAENWLISTMVLPKDNPRPGGWWYYATEGGQHVALWTEKALQKIASHYDRHLVSVRGGLHLFTRKPVSAALAKPILKGKAYGILSRLRRRESLLQPDYRSALAATNSNANQASAPIQKPAKSLACESPLDTPVALIMFNRPKQTEQVFDTIRRARPKELFLISDAPRNGHPSDVEKVTACRQRVESMIDWECEVTKIYAEVNMGCGKRIGSGISEVFEKVERAIILEDDCVPDLSFYAYCQELLRRYADDERVMSISGNNFQDGQVRGEGSYYFSKYPHCWGWATWRRAWTHFDLGMTAWPQWRDGESLGSILPMPSERRYWTNAMDKVYSGQVDTWDLPWMLSCWMRDGLTALPNVNLVTNIGFGEGATHTAKKTPLSNIPTIAMAELIHPHDVTQTVDADEYTFQKVWNPQHTRSVFSRSFWRDRLAERKAA